MNTTQELLIKYTNYLTKKMPPNEFASFRAKITAVVGRNVHVQYGKPSPKCGETMLVATTKLYERKARRLGWVAPETQSRLGVWAMPEKD